MKRLPPAVLSMPRRWGMARHWVSESGGRADACRTVLWLCALLVGGCAATTRTVRWTVASSDTQKSAYVLQVAFEWGAGNPDQTIQTVVEVGKEFYVKVADRAGHYHAIQGTLRRGQNGEFHLPLHVANWSATGGQYPTVELDLRVGVPWSGGTTAGGWQITLLPMPETLTVEPDRGAIPPGSEATDPNASDGME